VPQVLVALPHASERLAPEVTQEDLTVRGRVLRVHIASDMREPGTISRLHLAVLCSWARASCEQHGVTPLAVVRVESEEHGMALENHDRTRTNGSRYDSKWLTQ
jgi:hypothetical protein